MNASPDTALTNQQFHALNVYRRERTVVTVYLVNGNRLQGRIASFDAHTMLIRTPTMEALVYHHAVSTVERAGSARRRTGGPPGQRPSERGPERSTERSPVRGAERVPDRDEHLDDEPPPVRRAPPATAPTVTVTRRRSRLTPPRTE